MGIIIQGNTIIQGKTQFGNEYVAPGVLLGYTSNPGTFINDCTTAFTSINVSTPVYGLISQGRILGQLADNSYTPLASFYTDINCTTPLPDIGGTVYGFNITNGVAPNAKIRIGAGNLFNGLAFCTLGQYGYYVVSSTKVNVGSSNQCYGVSYYTTATGDPYLGQVLYSTGTGSFFGATTIAWAALPNVTATHLLTFTSGNSFVNTIA